MNHIRDKLPDMKARLNTLMGQAQQELNSFGDEAIYGDTNQARPPRPLLVRVSLTSQPRYTARRTRPPVHDPVRPRLCNVHRGYEC
jgi:hypothetical protein